MSKSEILGIQALTKKLEELDAKTGTATLRKVGRAAVKPTVAEMKSKIPVGQVPHRTYKGRLVAPGFASRSLTVKSKINRKTGTASTIIGVLAEAFYVVQFYDRGSLDNETSKGSKGWFSDTFKNNRQAIVREYEKSLSKVINRIAKK